MKNTTYLTILIVAIFLLAIPFNVYANRHELSFPEGESFIEQELVSMEKEFSRLSFEKEKLVDQIDDFYRRKRKNSSKNNKKIIDLQGQIASLNIELRAYQKRKKPSKRRRIQYGRISTSAMVVFVLNTLVLRTKSETVGYAEKTYTSV